MSPPRLGQRRVKASKQSLDRGGRVVSARIIGSSGSATLDQAAFDMARRAALIAVPTTSRSDSATDP
jgi:TonB family protein